MGIIFFLNNASLNKEVLSLLLSFTFAVTQMAVIATYMHT